MGNGGGCLPIIMFALIGWAILIVVGGASDAIDSREVRPKCYQEVLDMDNEHTNELIRRCMDDKVITVAELNAIRKRFNETSGPQAELEERFGE